MCFIALGPALQRPELFLSFLTSADALPLEPKICLALSSASRALLLTIRHRRRVRMLMSSSRGVALDTHLLLALKCRSK